MNPLFSRVIISLILIILSACAYSVERLVKDDKLRHKLIADCVKMGIKAKSEQNCINAAEAQVKVTGETVKGWFDK